MRTGSNDTGTDEIWQRWFTSDDGKRKAFVTRYPDGKVRLLLTNDIGVAESNAEVADWDAGLVAAEEFAK